MGLSFNMLKKITHFLKLVLERKPRVWYTSFRWLFPGSSVGRAGDC